MRKKLGELLIEAGAIDADALRAALGDQRRWGRPLGRTLVEMRLIREDELVRVLGTQLGLPSIDLDSVAIHPTVIALVPVELATEHQVIPFAQPMKFLDVAMLDPTNLGVVDELRIRTQLNIRPYLSGPRMIERAIAKYYGGEVHEDLSVDYLSTIEPSRSSGSFRSLPRRTASPSTAPPVSANRDAEIDALQTRISKLEALVARDEDVLRKLLSLLIDRGIATREEILDRLK
ncbi:MAG: hypothetical protein AB7P03_17260 [Kofleriaceae bacterium]